MRLVLNSFLSTVIASITFIVFHSSALAQSSRADAIHASPTKLDAHAVAAIQQQLLNELPTQQQKSNLNHALDHGQTQR